MTASSCALALFLANKSLPDLVIAGEELTDGSFADLLSELKGDPELAPIPFVVVTKRQAYPGMRRQAIELGASDLIEGPLNSRAVVDVIGKFLVAHDMTREPQTPE